MPTIQELEAKIVALSESRSRFKDLLNKVIAELRLLTGYNANELQGKIGEIIRETEGTMDRWPSEKLLD